MANGQKVMCGEKPWFKLKIYDKHRSMLKESDFLEPISSVEKETIILFRQVLVVPIPLTL
jgi:hypothetical protein